MASGKTHDRVTWAALPLVWLLFDGVLACPLRVTVLVTVGTALGGLLFSPDLDTRSRPFYRWGWFRVIWWPYQWAIRHRSGWSHGLVWASWLRVAYFLAVLVVLYCGGWVLLGAVQGLSVPLDVPRGHLIGFLQRYLDWIGWLGLGIWVGSLLHVGLDAVSSHLWAKRPRR